jgi:hypothetical protein
MPHSYTPPFTHTSPVPSLLAEIAGLLGRLSTLEGGQSAPTLRRVNRIRSILLLEVGGKKSSGEQVDEQVSEQVALMLRACARSPKSKAELLEAAGLAHAYLNYKRHIFPLIESGVLALTIPDKPNSRLQKYRLTSQGKSLL